jgi:hypothetical protein
MGRNGWRSFLQSRASTNCAVAVGALFEKTLLPFEDFGWSDAPVATGTLLYRPSTRDWLSTPSLRFKDSFSRTPYRFRPAMMMIA